MRTAGLQLERLDFPEDDPYAGQDSAAVLKRQVAERLAAHRSRRSQQGGANLIPIAEPKPVKARANRIATAVAERYAQTQSYRDFLAAEAERAIEEANAAAEIAARNAEAVTVAQQQLLAELEHWNDLEDAGAGGFASDRSEPRANDFSAYIEETPAAGVSQAPDARLKAAPPMPVLHPIAGATVRLYEDIGVRQVSSIAGTRINQAVPVDVALDEEENFLLDDEIAFRQTPVFAEPAGPTVPIPANLIEFPRQLVAPRKARPRLAEGPLREEADAAPAAAQLRIFEVEADQISTAPGVGMGIGVETVVPEWSSIRLDASPVAAPVEQPELEALLPLETASLNLRLMAAAVDGCILGAAAVAVFAAFALRVAELPSAPVAAMGAGATLLLLFVLYQLLFFTFADATPGMRYARIGLCTFADENPTRAQMRRRTWAILLSACPMGIGFLWALLDDDRLSWHDRISRMYQRGY
jgi:uncharacterized RDD family membrane protein YckC